MTKIDPIELEKDKWRKGFNKYLDEVMIKLKESCGVSKQILGGKMRSSVNKQVCSNCKSTVSVLNSFTKQRCSICKHPISPCSIKKNHPNPKVACNQNCNSCGPII